MVRLVPSSTYTIPVHPGTEGFEVQKLVVEKHVYKAPIAPCRQRFAFLFSHANGFHKEVMHPLIRRHVMHLRSQSKYDHVDIDCYAWDARNHGDSARLNEGTFLPTYQWFDNALDTYQVVSKMGLKTNYDNLIGIGHSFGATSMLLCEYFYPKTFDGLCVMEPILDRYFVDTEIRQKLPFLLSRKRRDVWPSREACYKSLIKRPFWKDFDPETLQNYVDYGLYETPDGTVKLKCPREQEYLVFWASLYSTRTAYSSIRLLAIPVHFVYAIGSVLISPAEEGLITGQSPNASISFLNGSHMFPNETPDAMIPEINLLLGRVPTLNVSTKAPLESKL